MRHNSILTTDEDWELYVDSTKTLARPTAWEAEIREKNLILKKYYERGQFDRYVTTAALLGLSYREYISEQPNFLSVRHPTVRKVAAARMEIYCRWANDSDCSNRNDIQNESS
jgi:hypothetical protein